MEILSGEGEALFYEYFIKEFSESSLIPSTKRGHSREAPASNQESPTNIESASAVLLDSQTPEL